MQVNPEIFRGYDIRGVAEKDLSPEILEALGQAYALYLTQRRIRETVVGMDCRASGPIYKTAFIKGLTLGGINVIDLGRCTSPMMYFAQYYYRTKGGAMLTASHNPAEWNGLKLATGYSDTMISEEIIALREVVMHTAFKPAAIPGKITSAENFLEHYKQDLLKRINLKKKFKVVVDACCSTPGESVPEILRAAGVEVIEKNCNIDSSFPVGTPDPTEMEVQTRLAKAVKEEGAAVGFSFDADGDRLGVVDGKGRILWNDMIVALLAADILDHLPGAKIVFNVLCSKVVTDVITQKGGKPVMWITGHSFIKAKAAMERAVFAGELSGHFFFTDNFYGHDDGTYTALRLLEYLANQEATLAEILDKLPQYISSPEIKIGCPDNLKKALLEKITANFKAAYATEKIIDIDGVRVDWKDKMLVVRYSQNGPYITVKYEAQTQSDYEHLKQIINSELKTYPELDWTKGVNLDALN